MPDLIDETVRAACLDAGNPLHASMVADPIFTRRNPRDNTPAITHVEPCVGDTLELLIAAKRGGSENRARYAMRIPGGCVADWVVDTVASLGARCRA
ncbi:MAG: fumarate hydratase [Pseudomonadota bacterium]